MTKHLVEEAFVLDINVIKKDLKRIREDEEVEGVVTIRNEVKGIQMNYWSIDRNGEKFLIVSLKGTEPQEIALQLFPLRYGTRSYYTCPGCFKKCNKLYVRSDRFTGFQCAKCNRLVYRLQSINFYSRLGLAEYKVDQMDKLFMKKKPRIFYAGKETKPFVRRIRKMEKIGMFKDAHDFALQVEEYKKISQLFSTISEYLHKSGNEGLRQTSF